MKINNIVQFERNAEFYFDLGYKYIQKGKLKTALRYLEKAARLKPSDAFIQFNFAGLLAELGDINKSTEVLLNIINNLEPEYSECYFGLGCNYLQQQKIKKSIEYFTRYMELDPDGEFAEESEDLLEMLTMIKDANNDLDDDELEKLYNIEEEAINHLERREYESAVKKFEFVVEMLPNAVPARNNLSLTYYYIGNIDKAIELAREVLNYEEDNIHANCNLAIYYNKQGLESWVDKQLNQIKKLNTDNTEYLYKIADTLGSLGKHMDAYRVYKKLIGIESGNPLYVHYTAVAAYNSQKFNDSIRLWKRLKALDTENYLSDFYINAAVEALENTHKYKELLYLYQLPKDELNRRIDIIYQLMELTKEELEEKLKNQPEVSELIYFGMIFDRFFLRKLIYNKFKAGSIKSAEGLIRRFALKKDIEDSINVESIFALDVIKAQKPYSTYINGELREIKEEPIKELELEGFGLWEQVKKTALQSIQKSYSEVSEQDIENLWYEFIKYKYPDIPHITKLDIWAAALEYAVCKAHGLRATQASIAEKHSVSLNTLREKSKIITDFLKNQNKTKEN